MKMSKKKLTRWVKIAAVVAAALFIWEQSGGQFPR